MPVSRKLPVVWSNRSLQQTTRIRDYLFGEFSEKEVGNFYKLLATFESTVSQLPKAYPESTFKKQLRRAVLNKFLSVYYSVKSAEIVVIAVLDNRMDYSRQF